MSSEQIWGLTFQKKCCASGYAYVEVAVGEGVCAPLGWVGQLYLTGARILWNLLLDLRSS